MTQNEWKEYLQRLIRTNDRALYRAIVVIGDGQTPEELALAETVDHNERGFGSVDAEFMTSVYFRIKAGQPLTPKQLAVARNKMPKYWKQLMRVAKARGGPPPVDLSQFVVRQSDGQICFKGVVMWEPC